MNDSEIKALVSLLDDDDSEISSHVEQQIKTLGNQAIPFLEQQWESSAFAPDIQKKIENMIDELHLNSVVERLYTWKKNEGADLLEGLWIIATYQYPELSMDKLRAEIEQIYYEVWLEFKENMAVSEQIRTLNHVFFGKLKFGVNARNILSTSNSMLNIVLETRKGNPISLCVIYLLVARKFNIPLFGVNLPNLFVLTYKNEQTQFYINVFNRGIVFSKNDIDSYITQLNLAPNPTFYEPCSHVAIVQRILRNLQVSFERIGNTDRLHEVKKLLQILLN